MIRKFVTAAVATAVIGTATLAAPTAAEAHGAGLGVGIAAGIIGGTILGAAIAQPHYYNDGPRYYYRPAAPVYYDDDSYVRCRNRRFVDDWGNVVWRRVCHRY